MYLETAANRLKWWRVKSWWSVNDDVVLFWIFSSLPVSVCLCDVLTTLRVKQWTAAVRRRAAGGRCCSDTVIMFTAGRLPAQVDSYSYITYNYIVQRKCVILCNISYVYRSKFYSILFLYYCYCFFKYYCPLAAVANKCPGLWDNKGTLILILIKTCLLV